MASSISRKQGLRCKFPHPSREGECGELLMEVRDGQLGITCQRSNGDHFTPLTVLLRQAEQKEWLSPKEQKEEDKVNETPTELSCREAQLLLRACQKDTDWKQLPQESQDAMRHYAQCEGCRTRGLGDICNTTIHHQEALEVVSRNSGPRYLFNGATLYEQLAIEHIWGHSQRQDPSWNQEVCGEGGCNDLRTYWSRVGLSSHYDGEREIAKQIPFLIRIFIKNKWSVTKLLTIQRERVVLLLDCLKNGDIFQSGYPRIEDVIYEVKEHLEVLQTNLKAKY